MLAGSWLVCHALADIGFSVAGMLVSQANALAGLLVCVHKVVPGFREGAEMPTVLWSFDLEMMCTYMLC